jgi:hypothetical protein
MSPLAPLRKWTVRQGIVLALVVMLPLVGLRGVAHADLGDEPSSKSSSSDIGQVEDNDKPKDLLEKKPADAAVEQQKKQMAPSTPFYEKWQFWAIAGGALVGLVALVLGANALAHQINGGDVRPCNMDFQMRCFGEGR